jgi:hypothetical protein
MHQCIADFNLEADDFLKAVPLGYGPKGLWYHPEKPVWLVTRGMFMLSKRNFGFQEVPNENCVWVYTDDPATVAFDGFTLPPHPLEFR